MFNYVDDGRTLYYLGYDAGNLSQGSEYVDIERTSLTRPDPDDPDLVITRDIIKFTLKPEYKKGDYIVSFQDGQNTRVVIFTDSFDTSTKYSGREADVDGYFKTGSVAMDAKNRISLLGDVRFNYVEEKSHTFYLRLRKGTGMVMGNDVTVSSDGSVTATVMNDKTMKITLDSSVTSGVHQAVITFKRANPYLKKVYEASFTIEFTDCASSGSMDVGFFIPMASGKFELYQAGGGDVVYKTVSTAEKQLGQADPGTVEIDTAVSNSVAYTPELNYDYKNTTPGEMTSDNPLITVSCELEMVSADDWVLSYQAKKPYVIATLSDDAPPGDHQATIHGMFTKSNGGYDITYTVIFHKEESSAEMVSVSEMFTDVSSGAWYEEYLQKAYDGGIIAGMNATSYGPTKNLTHAQIIVMIANLHNLQNGSTYDFQANKDVGRHWCSAFLDYCKAEGMIDDRFDELLDGTVNRGEMAYYFAHALSADSYKDKKTVDLIDIASNPYAEDILKLASADIVGGYSDKTYKAENLVTRAEAAVFISNIIDAIDEK